MGGLLLLIGLALSVARAEERGVLLVHVSDTHFPVAGTERTIAAMGSYLGVRSHVIVTGDLTEFGGLDSLANFDKAFGHVFDLVTTLGNHDATWRSLHDRFWARHGRPYYSHDVASVRVLALDSSTCQDPRPHWDPAELEWLASEVGIAESKPLAVAFHHPPWGSEFASAWARARLAKALTGGHVACLLTGHSHASSTRLWGGMRVIVGGSTFGDDAGFTTVELVGEKVTGVYHPNGKNERVLFTDDPVRVLEPLQTRTVVSDESQITVAIGHVHSAIFCELTGGPRVAMLDGQARIPLAELDGKRGAAPGPRGVVISEGEGGRITAAECLVPGGRACFSALLGGGARTTPVRLRGRLLVGTEDGCLCALEPGTGARLWRFPTGGIILGTAVLAGNLIVFGSGDGSLYALDADGRKAWERKLGAPLYASPVVVGDDILVTDLDGTLHAIAMNGVEKRKLHFADGPVEAPPLVADGVLYQGAWDCRVHAISLEKWAELWAAETDGPRTQKAKKYYSPADAPLALLGDCVAACDRDGKLTLLDRKTGERRGGVADAWSVAPVTSGLVVKGSKSVRRLDASLNVVWETELRLGRVPAAPLIDHDLVWTASDDGEAYALSVATGELVWRERVTPGEYVLASPGAAGDLVYFAALDGEVTAIARGR
ncbi:MAG TPA: PQQ-binding-like beta-propeller repeat protein [Planctomycetota bacterium]|nr:PQQ-binding-like beta-propeller repeat protein [Planctomycetota bacterium]